MVDLDLYIFVFKNFQNQKEIFQLILSGGIFSDFLRIILNKIKNHFFFFSPIEKISFFKETGEFLGSFGVPGPEDLIVQGVICIILQTIHFKGEEPSFDYSLSFFQYGFNISTSLTQLTQ